MILDELDRFLLDLRQSELQRLGPKTFETDLFFHESKMELARLRSEQDDLAIKPFDASRLYTLRFERASEPGLRFILNHSSRVRRWIWQRINAGEYRIWNPGRFASQFFHDHNLPIDGQEILVRLLTQLQKRLVVGLQP